MNLDELLRTQKTQAIGRILQDSYCCRFLPAETGDLCRSSLIFLVSSTSFAAATRFTKTTATACHEESSYPDFHP